MTDAGASLAYEFAPGNQFSAFVLRVLGLLGWWVNLNVQPRCLMAKSLRVCNPEDFSVMDVPAGIY